MSIGVPGTYSSLNSEKYVVPCPMEDVISIIDTDMLLPLLAPLMYMGPTTGFPKGTLLRFLLSVFFLIWPEVASSTSIRRVSPGST
ncbi:TPA: hypothetical protein EYP75_02005 [Candidatus Bathyarchaeota archaeon]|nr:hypothetical protein [Candidatus Bathyarchaeota archaeon]